MNADHTVRTSHPAWVVLKTIFRDGEQTHVERRGSERQSPQAFIFCFVSTRSVHPPPAHRILLISYTTRFGLVSGVLPSLILTVECF